MYFADMYCYGSDAGTVGITGIRGCMGIVYIGNGANYAIHIPPDSDDVQKAARKAFATFIKNNEQHVGRGNGCLFAFVNGRNRTTATGEMKDMKSRLGSPPTLIYRITKHLGPDSGGLGADAVVIMVEKLHAAGTTADACAIWYKRNDAITWVGGGTHEAGQYKVRQAFQGDKIPDNLNALWRRMTLENQNCTIEKV